MAENWTLWHRGSLRRFCSICCRVFIGRLTSEIEEHNAALAVPGVDCVVGAVHCAHVWLARWQLVGWGGGGIASHAACDWYSCRTSVIRHTTHTPSGSDSLIASTRASSKNISLRDIVHVTSMCCHRWTRVTSVSAEINQLFHDSFWAV